MTGRIRATAAALTRRVSLVLSLDFDTCDVSNTDTWSVDGGTQPSDWDKRSLIQRTEAWQRASDLCQLQVDLCRDALERAPRAEIRRRSINTLDDDGDGATGRDGEHSATTTSG